MAYGKLALVELFTCFLCTLPTHLAVPEPLMLEQVTIWGCYEPLLVYICKQQQDHRNDQGIECGSQQGTVQMWEVLSRIRSPSERLGELWPAGC